MRHFTMLALTFGTATLLASPVASQGDLFMRVTASDTGAEPYSGAGPVYLSPDIWVRTEPDPNFDPYPFPTNAPVWTPAPHQNPEYRDPKTSLPNYVYVRIHNRGRTPSLGTERLRLYEAKASTGLSWPASWVDNMDTACGMSLLHGIEITKPRMNAKDVSVGERQRYRDAVIEIASDTAYQYSDGMQYFTKQNVVHTSGPKHGNPGFPPWHREMVNRYERLLQEADPLATLLYWDFTENPVAGVTLFDSNFMGASSGTVTGALGAALPTTVTRNVGGSSGNCGPGQFSSDATLLSNAAYPTFRSQSENTPNHNCAHGFIGGYFAPAGPISSQSTAVRDPFFFLLHSNVDRQWATWQRDGADPARIDPVSAYGTDSSNVNITGTLSPWDGGFSVQPWTGTGVTAKNSFDRSIVFPPIYDTAPLRIPVLQPEESVVIEIPWFPPNKNNFDCAGGSGHFCLLARIETQTVAPYGMTTPETMNVSANTIANNNIAWKNVTIVDDVVEPQFTLMAGTTVRNFFRRDAFFALRLVDRTEKRRFLLQEVANVGLILPEDILERAFSRDGQVQDFDTAEFKGIDRKVLRLTGKKPVLSLPLKAGEAFTVQIAVQLREDRLPRELLAEPFLYDIEQLLDLPAEMFDKGERALEIGGVRFEFDIARALKKQRDGPMPEGVSPADVDQATEFRDLISADLTVDLQVERLRQAPQAASPDVPRLLSPGEPVEIVVGNDDPARTMQSLSVDVEGVQRFTAEAPVLRETVSFDAPGVYTIVSRGVDSEGRVEQRRDRVLVADNIPPITAILSPGEMSMAEVGQEIVVTAQTIPAFERQIDEVTLHVKADDLFLTGTDLVQSDAYPPIARSEGPGPHELVFVPDAPGSYMLQVGARDDAGNLGMSGHIMVEVR